MSSQFLFETLVFNEIIIIFKNHFMIAFSPLFIVVLHEYYKGCLERI